MVLPARPRLLLFDIDGTLLSCGPQVRPLFRAALEEVFGTAGAVDRFDFAGKTDPLIVRQLMCGAGVEDDRVRRGLPAVRRALKRRLEGGLRAEGMRLMPRVREVLEELRLQVDRGELWVGLLTGNWEATGRLKLSRLELDEHFAFGAFGDDGEDRRDLPPVALERAEAHTGERFRPEETVIIGDTPHDVACGRAHGLMTVGVATGGTPAEDLHAAGATVVVEDLGALPGWVG